MCYLNLQLHESGLRVALHLCADKQINNYYTVHDAELNISML